MNLELKDILAIWGAVTGTVGTIVAVHVWRLNRRLSTPRLIITRATGKIAETERGVDLHFQCFLSSQSNVASTVEWFELDLGRKLNRTTTTWARHDGADMPRLTHCATPGTAGNPLGKPGIPGDWGKPVVVPANSVVPSVHLTAKIYARDSADPRVPVQLKERLRNGRYYLIARLAAGREVALIGKSIEVTKERSIKGLEWMRG